MEEQQRQKSENFDQKKFQNTFEDSENSSQNKHLKSLESFNKLLSSNCLFKEVYDLIGTNPKQNSNSDFEKVLKTGRDFSPSIQVPNNRNRAVYKELFQQINSFDSTRKQSIERPSSTRGSLKYTPIQAGYIKPTKKKIINPDEQFSFFSDQKQRNKFFTKLNTDIKNWESLDNLKNNTQYNMGVNNIRKLAGLTEGREMKNYNFDPPAAPPKPAYATTKTKDTKINNYFKEALNNFGEKLKNANGNQKTKKKNKFKAKSVLMFNGFIPYTSRSKITTNNDLDLNQLTVWN